MAPETVLLSDSWVLGSSSLPVWACLGPAVGKMFPRSKVPLEDRSCLAKEETSGFWEGSGDDVLSEGGAEATFRAAFAPRRVPLGEASLGTMGVGFLLRAGEPSGSVFLGPTCRESTAGARVLGCCGQGPCRDFRAVCLPSGPEGCEEAAAVTWVWEKSRWDLVIIWNTCICSWLTRDS